MTGPDRFRRSLRLQISWYLIAAPLVVAGFGALSVALGQDANWDLANYHLYTAYAFLNGRIGADLAPAGFQSYFNPLLDLPYYALALNLPAPVAAFVMGCLHGLAPVLVHAIVRRVLPLAGARQSWLLALAGCLGATFLSEVGSSMGDNTTALLVLGALLMAMRAAAAPNSGAIHAMVAGLLVGAASGLKLTNAPFALGLAAALAASAVPGRQRATLFALASVGALAGALLLGGGWWWRMASEFGNPLFPQFNSIFHAPLAAPIGAADPRWGPKGWVEAIAWPFVFTISPKRLGETPLLQLLWPVAYVLVIGFFISRLRTPAQAESPPETGGADPRALSFLMTFVAASYLAWMLVFGIGRYAVAIEVLLPLVIWTFASPASTRPGVRRAAAVLIALSVVASALPLKTWGHSSFASQSFRVPRLPIEQPATATVLYVAQPVAWMTPFLPPEAVYVSLFNFPGSPAYVERAAAIVRRRGGEVWAVLPAAADTTANTVAHFNGLARRYALTADGPACQVVVRVMRASTRYRSYRPRPGGGCEFELPPAQRRDLIAENRGLAAVWARQLAARGMRLDAASCTRQEAFIGDLPQPFQFCRVTQLANRTSKDAP
jgi:hypothetical protein